MTPETERIERESRLARIAAALPYLDDANLIGIERAIVLLSPQAIKLARPVLTLRHSRPTTHKHTHA